MFGTELSLGETLVLRGQKLAVRNPTHYKFWCSQTEDVSANRANTVLWPARTWLIHTATDSFTGRRCSPGMVLCLSSLQTLRA